MNPTQWGWTVHSYFVSTNYLLNNALVENIHNWTTSYKRNFHITKTSKIIILPKQWYYAKGCVWNECVCLENSCLINGLVSFMKTVLCRLNCLLWKIWRTDPYWSILLVVILLVASLCLLTFMGTSKMTLGNRGRIESRNFMTCGCTVNFILLWTSTQISS